MNRCRLIVVLLIYVTCSFCAKNFSCLNRHAWRCKAKLREQQPPVETGSEATALPTLREAKSIICNCGKNCKGLRGLKAHQRSCKTIDAFKDQLNENCPIGLPIDPAEPAACATDLEGLAKESAGLRKGVMLPTKPDEWDLANKYFNATLPISSINGENIDENLNNFNNVVYDYFATTFGTIEDNSRCQNEIREKYGPYSKKQVKAELKRVKAENKDCATMSYLAKLLREMISKKSSKEDYSQFDHDKEIKKSFWGYCKRFLENSKRVIPTFSKQVCELFFFNGLRNITTSAPFAVPSWIPLLQKPQTSFSLKPPSYKEICKIVNKMKSSGSPCPLDQISIIAFKRCPYLRSYITAICAVVWSTKRIPSPWRKAITILVHKQGDVSKPENFRPITLEPVSLKIFTSFLRNRIYSFLIENQYAESYIQKGFIPGMSGTFEHIASMSYIINYARLKQRSVVITLLDLKNAFGEVNHDLIDCILEYHHVPKEVASIIRDLYSAFGIAIATNSFITGFIPVRKGVLQGDCLSPLIFNMIMHTFIEYIKSPPFDQFGFKFSSLFSHRHWFQFADDAAAVSSGESENQVLLNAFSRWCAWSRMIIRVDKCHTFGIHKQGSASKQFKPNLFINNQKVNPVNIGESFAYLGRHFDFDMSETNHKQKLTDSFTTLMDRVNSLPLHPRFKLLIYQRFILSKISWDLTVSDITESWVRKVLDNKARHYIRLWLNLPISCTLSAVTLTRNKYGLGIYLVSSRFLQCKVAYRRCLKLSKNPDVVSIHSSTSYGKNIRPDSYTSAKAVIKDIRKNSENRLLSKLTTQSLVMKSIWDQGLSTYAKYWSSVCENMPRSIYNFAIRYLNNSLSNRSNTHKWGSVPSPNCLHCQTPQTLGHVVGGCKQALKDGKFNWRHDSVLLNFTKAIASIPNVRVYSDLKDSDLFMSPSVVSGEMLRPDLIVIKGSDMFIMELTIGFETNMSKNADRKQRHYLDLIENINPGGKVRFLNLSMGASGVLCNQSTKIIEWLQEVGLTEREALYTLKKIMNVCLRCTYFLFCKRDEEIVIPKLLFW